MHVVSRGASAVTCFALVAACLMDIFGYIRDVDVKIKQFTIVVDAVSVSVGGAVDPPESA